MSRSLATLLLLTIPLTGFASDSVPYAHMDADLAELKRDFNDAADQVRLVFIVGPT